MSKLLHGLRVVDLTQFLSGPFCTQLLGGLGAEIIKVENPKGGASERNNTPFVGANGIDAIRHTDQDISMSVLKRSRNKKSITLNLKHPKGRDLLFELIKSSDIIMENFRPGTMEKLGLSYEAVHAVNPRIIYCSLNGFGDIPGYEKTPAFDIIIQALSGAMSVNGYPDMPPVKANPAIADLSAGLYSCIGILAAVIGREKTGVGQKVCVSMMESMLSLLLDETVEYWVKTGMPLRNGSRLTRLTPFNIFEAKDGYFVVASGTDTHWQNTLKAIGREDLSNDVRFTSSGARALNTYAVDDIINGWSKNISSSSAVAALTAFGIPCAEVKDITDVINDKNLTSAGAIVPVMHPTLGEIDGVASFCNPIRFSDSCAQFDQPAPLLGQDNKYVYQELLNLTDSSIAQLRCDGAI